MTSAAKVKVGLALLGLVLVVIVALQNSRPVTIDVLFWSATVDQLLLIPILFAAGVAVGLLLAWGLGRRRRGGTDHPRA